MTTIYLIRHSVRWKNKDIESYNTCNSRHICEEKIILSGIGEERAKLLSTKSIFDNVDVIYASDMIRTQSTGKYLCERLNLPMNIDCRFNERVSGIPNDKEYPDWFQRQYYDKNFKTVGGESQVDVQNRVLNGINDILNNYKDKNICIFTHGYAITFLLCYYGELISVGEDKKITIKYNDEIIMDKRINAPEVFKLEYDNDKLVSIKLIEFDDLEYMEGI